MTGPPPIPGSCEHRPVHGGYVVPFAQVILADGAPDFLSPHNGRTGRCWAEGLCQICGGPLRHPCIVMGGPNQLADLHFDEAPLCIPCAVYSSRACPMLGGRRLAYTTRAKISEGPRGKTCPDHAAGCQCGGFVPTDPDNPGHGGEPAHDYYACYVTPGGWQLTGKTAPSPCAPGCQCGGTVTSRLVINGAYLYGPPLKVVHVSAPGQGRIWRRLDAGEAAALITRPWYAAREAG